MYTTISVTNTTIMIIIIYNYNIIIPASTPISVYSIFHTSKTTCLITNTSTTSNLVIITWITSCPIMGA